MSLPKRIIAIPNPKLIAKVMIIASANSNIPAIMFPFIISLIEIPTFKPGIKSIIVPIIILSGCVDKPNKDGKKEIIPDMVDSIIVLENLL